MDLTRHLRAGCAVILLSGLHALPAAVLPVLAAGKELQPGWKDKVILADDTAATVGKALVLKLTPALGKETVGAYWGWNIAGQITRAPVTKLEPFHRYRAQVRLRVKPNLGSSSALVLYFSTDGTDYNPQITWRNVTRYYGFQFKQESAYQDMPAEFTVGEKGEVIPEIRVINMGPEPDGHEMGTGDLQEIALDSIRFEDITPVAGITRVRASLGNYRREDPKSAEIAVRNFSAEAQKVTLRVQLCRDVDRSVELLKQELTLAPASEQAVTIPIKGTEEFGAEVKAELFRGTGKLDAASDIFTVADNVYKIQMWTSAGPTNAPSFCWSGAVDMRRVPELAESIRAGCGNFYEFFAWPPDDGLDFVPKGDKWWAGQNGYPESKANMQGIIAELHKQGVKAVMYAAWWSCGTGIETFRRHPEWFLYDAATGRGGGCDIEAYKQAKKAVAEGKEGVSLQKNGGGAAPNWGDPQVVDAGLNSMRESRKMFGWDGVRWDGEYQMTFFWDQMDMQGRKVADLYKDMDVTNTRILRQIIERFKREEPTFVWGYNSDVNPKLWGDKPPQATAYKLAQGGSLMWESPREANSGTNPNHTFQEYSRNTCEMADYCRTRGGYFMQFPAGAGWVGTVHDRIYKTIIPVAGGSTVYGNNAFLARSIGDYNRFIARYCSLWWGDDVRSLAKPETYVNVTAPAGLWWKDYVDTRPAGFRTRDIILHLVNEPVNKVIGPEVTGAMPKAQEKIRIDCTPAAGKLLQAWLLTPEPEITCVPLPVETTATGGAAVTVPRLQCWDVVVLRVRGGAW